MVRFGFGISIKMTLDNSKEVLESIKKNLKACHSIASDNSQAIWSLESPSAN